MTAPSSPPPFRALWLMPVVGERSDLDLLVHWTLGSAVHVAEIDGAHQLVLPFSEAGSEHEDAREAAAIALEAINSIGAVLYPVFMPVALTGSSTRFDESGARKDSVFRDLASVFRIHGRLEGPVASPGIAAGMLSRALQSGDVMDALVLAGRAKPTWAELFVAFELVQSAVGNRIHAEGWVSSAEINRFTATANNRRALGRLARHGRASFEKPKNPMTHVDAMVLIRRLVQCWASDASTSL